MQVNDLVESEKDKKEQIRGQLPLDFFPEKQPTLSNFIVGSNSEAVAVISELKEGRGPQFSYLWGYEGVGKTHLVLTAFAEVTQTSDHDLISCVELI